MVFMAAKVTEASTSLRSVSVSYKPYKVGGWADQQSRVLYTEVSKC